jgi:iron(III) transport system substrate-binding protein
MAHGADIFRAFNEKYPDIQIEEKVALTDDNAQALLTEIAAGRQPSADLMYGEPSVLQPIFDANGADESIDWKSLGIPDDYLLGEHAAVRLYRISLGLLFNSASNDEAALPSNWDEVLDPKWTGKIVVDPRGRPFDFISLLWGHDKTIDYVKKLKALDPQVIKGGAVGGQAVVDGAAAFSAGGRTDDLGDFQATGAPAGLKYLDVIPTLDTFNIVPKGAQHPNAAKCLVAWLAAEGQAVHDEAEHKSNSSTPPEGAPANATFVSPKNPQEAQSIATIGAEIGAIFTGTGN